MLAAAASTVCGLGVAWVLARVPFRGRRLLDAFVDVTLALPTAVAGLVVAGLALVSLDVNGGEVAQ